MSIKKIPRHAEATFASMCAAAGVTCNQSTEDERGWDFFVQFPKEPAPNIPLDMTPPGEECLVQIKTNSGERRGVELKLSNALEFSTNRLPCFVVLFVYHLTSSEANTCYVLHFWSTEIARTLKRVRELDVKGKRINRFSLRFPLSSMTAIKPSDLLDFLRSEIRRREPHYSENKRMISGRVGFEGPVATGHISFREGTTIDEIIDLQIGLKDNLEVSLFSSHSIRFGVPAKAPIVEAANAVISMRSHPKACVLQVSSETAIREVSLPSELFVPAIPGLPEKYLRFRVSGRFVEFIFNAANDIADFTGQWDGRHPYALSDLLTVLDLMYIFGSKDVRFNLIVNGMPLMGGVGSANAAFNDHPVLQTVDRFVHFLAGQLKEHDVPDAFRISLSDLIDRAQLIMMHNLLVENKGANGSGIIQWLREPYTGPGKILYYTALELPGFVIYTIVRRNIEVLPEHEGRVRFVFNEIDYARPRIIPGTYAETEDFIRKDVDSRGKEGVEGFFFIMGRVGEAADREIPGDRSASW